MTRHDEAERQYIQAVLAGDFVRAEAYQAQVRGRVPTLLGVEQPVQGIAEGDPSSESRDCEAGFVDSTISRSAQAAQRRSRTPSLPRVVA